MAYRWSYLPYHVWYGRHAERFGVARWPAPVLDSCAAGLCVTVSLSGGTLRVHVVGDIDLATAPRLKAMLDLSRLEDVYRLSWTCLE